MELHTVPGKLKLDRHGACNCTDTYLGLEPMGWEKAVDLNSVNVL